VKKEDNKDIV
jgi:hypothetical protein